MEQPNTKSTQEKMNELEGQMQEQMAKYRKSLEEAEKNLSETAQELRTIIKKHPLAAVGIALTLGFLIGRCFGSRK